MEQTVGWDTKDVHECNDPGSSLESMKRSSTSIENDLDSGCQDVGLDNRSPTPPTSKDSQEESDGNLSDRDDSNFDSKLSQPLRDTDGCDKVEEEAVRDCFGDWAKVPDNWSQLDRQEKLKILEDYVRRFFPHVPDSLVMSGVGSMFPEDSGRLPSDVPDWLDKEKFERGQRFARDNIFGIFLSDVMALYVLYTFKDGVKPVILTGNSSEPYTSFKRFLSTVCRVRNWYTSDPWTEGTPAYNDMQAVRRLHAMMRKRLFNLTLEEFEELVKIDRAMAEQSEIWLADFRECCPAAKPGQCPYAMPGFRKTRVLGLSQGEMSFTMFGFVGLPILFPEAFGMHDATYEDLEAFTHLWRGLGYLLGIEDEFNFCRGTFEETRQRCADFLEYFVKPNFRDITPEYEHMMRCIFEGLEFYCPGVCYDSTLLYLTDLMGLKMPRLRASMSYRSWITYNVMYLIMDKLFRYSWVKTRLNKRINLLVDKGCMFDDKKHLALQKRSDEIIAKVLENIAKKKVLVPVNNCT